MADNPLGLAKGALLGLGTFLGLVSTVTGLASASMVAALNTLGVLGFGTFFVGLIAWSVYDGRPDNERIKAAATATLIGAVVVAVLYFVIGRPLDESERQFNILSFMGIATLLGGAFVVASVNRTFQPAKKTCPECANEVLAAARRCQYCGHRFDHAVGA